ncbi:thioredoxin-like domain-containing protein [Pseudokineococcus basanitobsidens]|uniref:Thioredoxin-like domain-containing protein n=1 Tax=Pseudokineococcus basanitobsidens TaxID=1926649 RepID=A0ABU8RGB2_9ACTN
MSTRTAGTARSARTPRTRAPELVGRRWVGTDGRVLRLADLRGRFVLLDFWTSCCVNCLHVLSELRDLEERWAAELVVVGVHSPKFPHEAEPDVLDDAVRRYEVHHPVLDDADMATWQAYAARAWPTLVLVDPTGYVVASLSGEGHAHGLDALLTELVAEHDERGTLVRGERLFTPLPRRRRTTACVTPAALSSCPSASAAGSSSRTPGTTASRCSTTTSPCCGPSARGPAASSTATPRPRPSRSRRACACCPTTWPRAWVSTSSSRTARTTPSAASGSGAAPPAW